ncbi:MAG: ATP-binding protein [Actinomycetota bacterium]|nr:ATP-binding protein [Actinomycetota bacterium]
MTEPERLTPEELRTLFLFEHLNDDQVAWLAERGRIVEYAAGATIHAEGSPASCFFVLLSGTLAMSNRVQGGELELFRTDYYGAYTGAFDFYLADHRVPQLYPGTARAVTDCGLFELPAAEFGKAFQEWFPMAAHLLVGSSTQGRAATETVARHERLVALGSVTAGLTHELNNPVTAVARATARLREMLAEMRENIGEMVRSDLPANQLEAIADLAGRALERRRDAPSLSPLETSDREDELADWLEQHGVTGAWEIAPTLVAGGLDLRWLENLAEALPPGHLEVGLSYPVRALESDGLLDEVTDAAERISGLLAAAKQYTQMDRAPLQSFDVHEGLDATLTMLGHKIGDDIEVVRDYDASLPKISAFPGELNQVWTNLIDNAVDAMDGHGKLTVRTQPDGDDRLMVEIGDTGPGIPGEARNRVFEPFFTTKEVGKGTGLGLDIAWRIVVGRHAGEIRLESAPGDTRFQVVVPIRQSDQADARAR